MKLRAAAALLAPLFFALSAHASSQASSTPTPSLLDQMLHAVHLEHAPKPQDSGEVHHGLELKIAVAPEAMKLSVDHEVTVTVTLLNRSKKYVHLNFPTSQRIEILVKDSSGKVVNTWSEDQSFTSDPASVTINPGERLEYTASVATREMTAGKPYTIEASFPSYPDLKIQRQVTPEK